MEKPGKTCISLRALPRRSKKRSGACVRPQGRRRTPASGSALDRLGIGDHSVGRFIQAQQHGHRDRPADQRVGQVGHDPLRVVGQQAWLDVAVDEEIAAQCLEQLQAWASERHVKLDLEGRRGQHKAAHFRRVVMGPGRHQHRPTLWASTTMSASAMPWLSRTCSMKVCTSRTLVAKPGLSPRAPGDWPWPRASQAKSRSRACPAHRPNGPCARRVRGRGGTSPPPGVAGIRYGWRANSGNAARRHHGCRSAAIALGAWRRSLSGGEEVSEFRPGLGEPGCRGYRARVRG